MILGKRQAGFTLIELLIVLAIIGILAAGGFYFFGSWRSGSATHAEREFAPFAQKLGWEVVGVACTSIDSDGDGYISCTARVREGDRITNQAVECASGAWALPWNKTGGCKLVVPTQIRQ